MSNVILFRIFNNLFYSYQKKIIIFKKIILSIVNNNYLKRTVNYIKTSIVTCVMYGIKKAVNKMKKNRKK